MLKATFFERAIWSTAVPLIVASSLAAVGCRSDSGAVSDLSNPEAPYAAASENVSLSFETRQDGGAVEMRSGRVVGTRDAGAVVYSRLRVADSLTAPQKGIESWHRKTATETWEFLGGEAYTPLLGIGTPGQALISGTVDQPLSLDATMPVGQPLNIDTTGQATIAGVATATRLQGTITAVADGVSYETAAGVLHGCRRFQGSFTLSGSGVPSAIASAPFTADLWYHSQYGVAGFVVRLPPFVDTSGNFRGSDDTFDLPGGYRMTQKMAILDASRSVTSVTFSTYDYKQAYDADKNTHAKMLLEVRYLNEAEAVSAFSPAVSIEFGTVIGTFPAQLTRTTTSFFHPNESGRGYSYWVAFVDQAAKNESTNPIAYHIKATLGTNNTKVRVTARILYKVVE
ncbi:MAG: hypothetical protein HYY84_01045 [Deltaproteobacteria bacterium]|nr:hypothetical protein [Deltaproteobacteria bacterium]